MAVGSGAVELGVGYVSVVPSAKGFSKELNKQLNQASSGAEAAGQKVGKQMSSGMAKALKVGGAAAGAAAVAGIGLAMKGGLDAAMNIDAASRSLTGLHGSAETAADTLERVGRVARDSSIDHADYAEAAKNLAYIGVEGEQLESILDNAGKAIVGFGGDGSNLERVNDSLAKMVNNGKVNREELLQLSGAGIPVFEGLSKHLGVTVEEMNDMVSKGMVGIEDVLSVMEDGTGDYFGQLLDAGDEMEKGLGATWARLKDNLKLDIGEAIINSGVLDAMVPALDGLADALVGVVGWTVNDFIPALQTAGEWVKRNRDWIAPLAVAIGAAASAWGLWVGAIKLWQTVTKVATGIQAAFNAVMAANPIMLVVIAIAALVAGLTYFFAKTETGQRIWESFTNAISVGWEWVKNAFSAAWAFIQPIFTQLWDIIQTVGEVFVNVVKAYFVAYWNILSSVISFVWNSVIKPVWDAMRAALQALGDFFKWVWNSVIKPAWDALGAGIAFVWNSVIRPAWDALKSALDVVGKFFQNTWNNVIKPAWDALGNGIRAVWTGVISPAFEALKSGLGSVRDFFRTTADGIRNIWDQVKGHVARPINVVIDAVWNNGLMRAWDTIRGFLPGLPAGRRLSPVAFATGGAVFGPGTGTSDSILARLSAGEHVLTAAEVRAMGGHDKVYAMREMIRKGGFPAGHGVGMPGFADGGAVPGRSLSPTPGEGGLKDIAKLAKRLIHLIWPSITTIGGYRQDAYPEHPSGRALDVMVGVGNPIGDEVTSWALANNPVLPLQHALWKQTVWTPNGATTPMGDRGDPTQNHMDHPHLWYRPHNINPNIVPEGLVGADGLSREDRMGIIKDKVKEILDKMMDPLISGMIGIIGSPPPEWLGIPPSIAKMSKDGAVDGVFGFVEKIGDDLRDIYNEARKVKDVVVSSITGLFRDNGGFIPAGKSVVNNETGKPEAVLNWKQLEQVIRLMETAAGFAALEAWAYGDPSKVLAAGISEETVAAVEAMGERISGEIAVMSQTFEETWRDGMLEDALGALGVGKVGGTVGAAMAALADPDLLKPKTDATEAGTSSPLPTAGSPAAGLVYANKTVDLDTKMPDLDASAPGSGPVKDQVKAAFAKYGWDKDPYWAAVDWIVGKESTWDPMARNPSSGAFGLFQFLGGTKDTYLPDENANPKVQGAAGAKYIKDRYGDPLKAKAFWEANGWYDQGGWLKPGVTLTRNDTGKPEAILNPAQWSMISRQIDVVEQMANGASGATYNVYANDLDEAMKRLRLREAQRAQTYMGAR